MAMLRTGSAASISLCAVVMLCLAACSHGASAPPKAVKVAAIASNAAMSSWSPGSVGAPGLHAPAAAAAPVAAAPTMPGVNPAIQKWLLDNGKKKIDFDQALFQAEKGITAKSPADCQPLNKTAHTLGAALSGLSHVPDPAGSKIASLYASLMTKMESVATACVNGDFAGAQTQLDTTAIPQQADTQASVDDILDEGK
jgi:hypothetical protein